MTQSNATDGEQTRDAKRVARITDARAIRALAHDVRQRLVSMLGAGRELTASEAAAEIGISPSAMSYHLRLLAKYGLAERADPSEDGRERRWRGTFDSLVMAPGQTDQGSAAAHLEIFQTAMRQSVRTTLDRPEMLGEQGGAEASVTIGRTRLHLTPQQSDELSEQIHQLVRDYDRSRSTESTVPVDFYFLLAPQGQPGAAAVGPEADDKPYPRPLS